MNAWEALALAAVSAVVLVRGVTSLYRSRFARLPKVGSVAREPMRRLAEAEATLAELLGQLDDERLPTEWVDHTRRAIANTSGVLRAIAFQIQADERALGRATWRWERVTLTESTVESVHRIGRCLNGYDQLIAALGHAVASTAPPPLAALTEATDRLTGLAEALRELHDHDR